MALMKMTILAFKSFDKPTDLLKPRLFMAMYNPASYKVEYTVNKDTKEPSGTDTPATPPTSVSPRKMTFDFVFDGTNANGEKRIVLLETKNFENVVMPEKKDLLSSVLPASENLKLPKLLLLYGTFMFSCEIEAFSINYTLFDTFGIPLRATINATFSEVDPGKAVTFLNSITESATVNTITNVASFLNNAFAITQNVAAAVQDARDKNLNSLRQEVKI
jgi:hypothetical protein